MLIIFNWITVQSIILHSILFNYGSVHICENSNRLGRVTSQSKVENKMALYQAAATAKLDLEARRKAKEASKARRRKICCLKQQQQIRQFLVKQALTFVLAFLLIVVDQTILDWTWTYKYWTWKLHSKTRYMLLEGGALATTCGCDTVEIGYQCRVQNTCSVNGNWPFYSLSKTRIPCKIRRQGCWPVSGKFFLCLRV